MRSKFEISVGEWFVPVAPEQDYTIASLSIRLYDTLVTEIADRQSRSLRDFLRVSAGTLAEWFARNYWRLLHEGPQGRDRVDWLVAHSTAAAGDGYVWPKLIVSSDGTMVRLNDRSSDRERFGDVTFVGHRRFHYLTISEFRNELVRFVGMVVDRLRDNDPAAPLIGAWEDLLSEMADPEVALYRRIEARLGYGIDEAPEAEVLAWDQAVTTYGEDTAAEFLAAHVDVKEAEALRTRAAQSETTIDAHRIVDLANETDVDTSGRAWRPAKDAADRLRHELGLDGPVQPQALHELFGIEAQKELTNDRERAAGLDEERGIRAAFSKNNVPGVRFEAARLIGDYIGFTNEPFRPVLEAGTWRQQFQRSFGQAFLAPIEGIREHAPPTGYWTERAVEHAAERFMVSTWVVDDALRNYGDIPQTGVIERHAGPDFS